LTLVSAISIVWTVHRVAAQAHPSELQLPIPAPKERAALVVVGPVESVRLDDEYHQGHLSYRVYAITLKVTQVLKGDGPKVGDQLHFTARHIYERQVGLLQGGNSLFVTIPRDEVDWVPQVGDTVRVCLDPSIGYHAVHGLSITPEPVPQGGPPVTAVGTKRVMESGDWVIIAIGVGVTMFIAGVLVGRRLVARRSGVSAGAQRDAAADRPRD
jgi:hypothetical protein